MEFNLNKSNSLRGEIMIPPDKSMSHRAVMFNSLAAGKAKISNFLMGDDCLSTISVLKKLGSKIHIDGKGNIITNGQGMNSLEEPNQILNVGNSGTTIRLMSGVLAGRKFRSVLDGDKSIRRRPMGRVVKPLSMMGAIIKAKNNNENAPIEFIGGELKNINYEMPVASAQLKSALILAGLRSKDGITINQPALSRDHTERLLGFMGATIKTKGLQIQVMPSEINAVDVIIPGDISSASYWLVAGSIHKNADLTIKNVGINNTRAGIINVLNRMGAKIKMFNKLDYSGEPVCDINISTSNLNATSICGEEIPLLIDEIPIIALAAVFAEGETKISDAEELRYKESDRIALTVEWMRKAGAQIEELQDGMIIKGNGKITGGKFSSHGDHRLAMTLGIASLISEKPIEIENSEVSNVSYPKFWETLQLIGD